MLASLFRSSAKPEPTQVVSGRVASPDVRITRRQTDSTGWMVTHPRYELFLRRAGITDAKTAYDLPGEIVGGHVDRHVVRCQLTAGQTERIVFLKREHTASLKAKIRNQQQGFGWVSRAEREAEVLMRLEAAKLPGPQWLAYGCDPAGRAFLIVEEIPEATDLASAGQIPLTRKIIKNAATMLAEIHAAGFTTPELAAKHLFVNPSTQHVTLIDWQTTRFVEKLDVNDMTMSLANLLASMPGELDRATLRRFLIHYDRAMWDRGIEMPDLRKLAESVETLAKPLANRSSIRDQRSNEPQRLVWLAGEGVCVIPEVSASWPTPVDTEPFYISTEVADHVEERITLPNQPPAILHRFQTCDPVGRSLAKLRERPWRSPGAVAGRVLIHCQRLGIMAPKLLAFGQKLEGAWSARSFVLLAAEPSRVSLALHLLSLKSSERQQCLTRTGEFLRQVHDAKLRFHFSLTNTPSLSVSGEAIGLASPLIVEFTRRLSDRRRLTNLHRFLRCELPQLTRRERLRVMQAYWGQKWPQVRRAVLLSLR
ncbi:MAG: lipopolysaccharide kinase InaA family protein [Fimbriiglobus sp.]